MTLPEGKDEDICLRCSCGYESRNAALIGVSCTPHTQPHTHTHTHTHTHPVDSVFIAYPQAIVYGMLVVMFLIMPIFTVYVCVVLCVKRAQSLRAATNSGYDSLQEVSFPAHPHSVAMVTYSPG